jgi:hypothetical protein
MNLLRPLAFAMLAPVFAGCASDPAAACVVEVGGVDICMRNIGAVSWCRDIGGTGYSERRDEVFGCEDVDFAVPCPGTVKHSGEGQRGGVQSSFEAEYPYSVRDEADCEAAEGVEIG